MSGGRPDNPHRLETNPALGGPGAIRDGRPCDTDTPGKGQTTRRTTLNTITNHRQLALTQIYYVVAGPLIFFGKYFEVCRHVQISNDAEVMKLQTSLLLSAESAILAIFCNTSPTAGALN